MSCFSWQTTNACITVIVCMWTVSTCLAETVWWSNIQCAFWVSPLLNELLLEYKAKWIGLEYSKFLQLQLCVTFIDPSKYFLYHIYIGFALEPEKFFRASSLMQLDLWPLFLQLLVYVALPVQILHMLKYDTPWCGVPGGVWLITHVHVNHCLPALFMVLFCKLEWTLSIYLNTQFT